MEVVSLTTTSEDLALPDAVTNAPEILLFQQ